MITDLFTQSIVIQRATNTADGLGGYSQSWSNHLTINGLISPISADEVRKNDKLEIVSTHKMYCLVVDVTELDRVTAGGKTYKITGVRNPMLMDHHLEIDLLLEE